MILVIDESELLFGLLEPMLEGSGVSAVRAKDVPTAKRKLLESSPRLILCFNRIGTDKEAGYRFCSELKTHPLLSQVPVLLFAEELSEETLRRATESGARGIAPWPIGAESLLRRVGMLLPELASQFEQETAPPPQKAGKSASPRASSSRNPALSASSASSSDFNLNVSPPGMPQAFEGPRFDRSASDKATAKSEGKASGVRPALGSGKSAAPLSDFDRKLQAAQQILAKVLYDLKTSHLLQVVDAEDVPRVVAELTRTICSVGPAEKGKRSSVSSPVDFDLAAQLAEPPKTEQKQEEAVTGIDLEKIFGIKKS